MIISNLLAYAIAIAIPCFAIYLMYTLDMFGTGRSSTVLFCLIWGGVAVGLVYPVNTALIGALGYTMAMTLAGPVVEELFKSAALFYFITRPRFRYVVDGAVYGFASGIGFSVIENIYYLMTHPGGELMLAISRVLSTSLMHATTSALIGLSLGHLRRSRSRLRYVWVVAGFVPAMGTHIVFNNVVDKLTGPALLLVAIGIGVGGAALIAYQVSNGIAEEKKRFAQTLGLNLGVTDAERKAVQSLGSEGIEAVLKDLSDYFGAEKITKIRRLLVTQANIGILQNNLSSPVSDRLRKAWRDEIAQKRAEIDGLRGELGVYVMSFLRGVFPEEDEALATTFSKAFVSTDPTQVHAFDLFMNMSKAAGTLPAEQIAQTAEILQQIPFFKEVSLADLENLSRAITLRTYEDGQMLFDQGEEGDTMYLIEEGAIRINIKGKDGKDAQQLRLCFAGDVVGELALLDGHPRSARARAEGALKAFVLRREHFTMFIQSRPNVILPLLQYMAHRARTNSYLVDQSIEWASKIAQGNYQAAHEISLKLAEPTGANIPLSQRLTAHGAVSTAPGGSNLNEDAPLLTHSVFAKMSGALEAREKALKAKAAESGVSIQNVADLPETQQYILNFLRDNVPDPDEGATSQALQSELSTKILHALLAELSRKGLIIASGSYYKLSPRLKRSTPAAKVSVNKSGVFARFKVDEG